MKGGKTYLQCTSKNRRDAGKERTQEKKNKSVTCQKFKFKFNLSFPPKHFTN